MRHFVDKVYCECADDIFYQNDHWRGWSRAQEAYLWHILDESYNQESRSYATMQDIQGVHIPRIFGRVSVQANPLDEPDAFLEVRRFLMEYVEGFTLGDCIAEAPREAWQGICDEVISIVDRVSSYGICTARFDHEASSCDTRMASTKSSSWTLA